MPFNGNGVFVRLYSWVNDAANNIRIRADRMDNEMNGMAQGLTNCITRDGQSTVTSDLPMGGYKHTNISDGTSRNHYSSLGQFQDGIINWSIASGTVDAITAAHNPTVSVLKDGQLFNFRSTGMNTSTTPTFNPDSLGSAVITKEGGIPLVAGDIGSSGSEHMLRYRSSPARYELINPKEAISILSRTQVPKGFLVSDGTNMSVALGAFNHNNSLYAVDSKAQNTAGGTNVTGTWQTRTLSSTTISNITGASLVANQVTLPAGTYICFAQATAFNVNGHKIRIQNITDASTLLFGSPVSSINNVQTSSVVYGRSFTLSAQKVIELQHQTSTVVTTNGLGVPTGFGSEIYSELYLAKVG